MCEILVCLDLETHLVHGGWEGISAAGNIHVVCITTQESDANAEIKTVFQSK